jgi:hypothetical protein
MMSASDAFTLSRSADQHVALTVSMIKLSVRRLAAVFLPAAGSVATSSAGVGNGFAIMS